jgi:hypothetical protein
MPIHAPNPPAAALEAVRNTVRSFAEEAMFRTPALRAAQPDQLTINEPHQVFLLGLDDLRAGADLSKARLVGWRYLVQEGDRVIATAESALAGQGDRQVFSASMKGHSSLRRQRLSRRQKPIPNYRKAPMNSAYCMFRLCTSWRYGSMDRAEQMTCWCPSPPPRAKYLPVDPFQPARL